MILREVTAVVRLSPDRAVLFGVDWNATVRGDVRTLDEFERIVPFAVDIVAPPAAGAA